MLIKTKDPALPFDLRNTKPDGVSVIFDNPRLTRDLNSAIPTVLVTLYFSANIDINAVARWLFEKMSPCKAAYATYEKTKVKIEFMALKIAIEKEIKTHKK